MSPLYPLRGLGVPLSFVMARLSAPATTRKVLGYEKAGIGGVSDDLLAVPSTKVLHVVAEMGSGGAERIILHLVRYGRDRGLVSEVAAVRGPWSRHVAAMGGACHDLPPMSGLGSLVPAAAAVRRLITTTEPDVVHVHNVRMSAVVRIALLGIRRNIAVVTTLHGVSPSDERLAGRVLRACGWPVITVAPHVAESLTGQGFPSDRHHMLLNGGSLGQPTTAEVLATRSAYGLDERPMVLGIGRLVEQKSWDRLIDAAALIPGVQVVIAGDGELRSALEAHAREVGVSVVFVGHVEDPAKLIGLAEAVVCCSKWEGLPMVALEALSLGVPVVASQQSRIGDVLSGDAVIELAIDSPECLAGAIKHLASNGHAALLRDSALAIAKDFSVDEMGERYLAMYSSLATSEERIDTGWLRRIPVNGVAEMAPATDFDE